MSTSVKVSSFVTALTAGLVALVFIGYGNSGLHEYVETRFSLPVLFKLRDVAGRTTTLDPRLKIFAYDDTSFARQGVPDLPLATWAKILKGLADRRPAAIYVDKFFALPPEADAADAEAIATLRRLDARIVTTSFVTPGEIKYRTPMRLDGPLNTLSSYYDGPVAMLADGFIPMRKVLGWKAYGADRRLLDVFTRAGHSMNAGFGKATALLEVAPGRVLPHMVLMGADRMRVQRRELYVDGKGHVPLDAEGRMVVDFARPSDYVKASRRMLALLDRAEAGEPQTMVDEGDYVLILPAMFTGHTDFTVTPVGPLPGPYVIASLINSYIKGEWIEPVRSAEILIAAACALGALAVVELGAFTWLGLALGVILWGAVSVVLFAWFRILPDVTTPAVAFLTTGLVASVQRNGVAEKLVLFLRLLKTENERLQLEIDQAGQIARAFRPAPPPRWQGLDVGACHRSLTSASGDWYAFESAPSGRLVHFVMCDISGHGVPAAIVVSTCKTVLGMMARDPTTLESDDFIVRYAELLNETLFRHGRGGHVTTLAGVTFSRDTGEVRFVGCGHPQPIVLRRGDAGLRMEMLTSYHNPLGIDPSVKVRQYATRIEPGEHLIVYTDGVKLPRSSRRLEGRLRELSELAAQDAATRMCQIDWSTGRPDTVATQDDDVSLVWFARRDAA